MVAVRSCGRYVSLDFWSFCLNRLERELPSQQFNTWIKALEARDLEVDGPALQLVAPNRFVLQWVRERYAQRIAELGDEYYGSALTLDLSLPANGAPAKAAPSTAQKEKAKPQKSNGKKPNVTSSGKKGKGKVS